jgi:hypothetical protein
MELEIMQLVMEQVVVVVGLRAEVELFRAELALLV